MPSSTDKLNSDTDLELASNYLDYSSDGSYSELRFEFCLNFYQGWDVLCPQFKLTTIPFVHMQVYLTFDIRQFYVTFTNYLLMSKFVEETNK